MAQRAQRHTAQKHVAQGQQRHMAQGQQPHKRKKRADSREAFGTKDRRSGGYRPRDIRTSDDTRGARKPRTSRQKSAFDLIEGRRAVAEALALNIPLKNALVQVSSGERDQEIETLAKRLSSDGVPVERVPRQVLDALSSHGAHQGVIVRTRPFEYAELSDILEKAGSKDALVVVLDHVTDEGNFGAIVRSAEVVGAAGVVIANARAAQVGVGAYKTSAGAVLHVPIARVSNVSRALEELKTAGFWACGATEHATDDVWSAPLGGRLALVMGSEGAGISRLVLETCDFACKLPQRGKIESLNVAQATTVMCYEWLRRVSMGGVS